MPSRSSLAAWLSAEKKAQFQALARQQNLSDSQLLGLLVDALLRRHASPQEPVDEPAGSRTERITVRLRPGDAALLRQRAHARHLKDSTYLAALVRSHLRASPPMPGPELEALKRTVAELSALGREPHRLQRSGASGSGAQGPPEAALQATLDAVERLRAEVKAVVKTHLRSWEAEDGEATA